MWASVSKPANELGVVGEFRSDHLDRHIAPHRWLGAAVHDTERTAAEFFEKLIAAKDGAAERLGVERGIAGHDLLLQLTEMSRWFEAHLVAHQREVVLVDAQCVGLTTGTVQRDHELGPRSLPCLFLAGESFEIGDHLGMATKGKLTPRPILDGGGPNLDKPRGLGESPRLIRELGVRPSFPLAQCSVEGSDRAGVISTIGQVSCGADKTFEHLGVEVVGAESKDVAGADSIDHRLSLIVGPVV